MSQSQPKTPEIGAICEGCRNPNAWMLIDPIYTYVCGGCAESGTADVLYMGKVFRGFRTCKCGARTFMTEIKDGKLNCRSCAKELFLGGVAPVKSLK